MSTQEERLSILEQKVADIELERLYEKRKASSSPGSEQLYDAQQINHRLTMLLGIASGQEQSIKVMGQDISGIKNELSEVKQNVENLHGRFDNLEVRFDNLETRFDRLEKLLLDRLPPA